MRKQWSRHLAVCTLVVGTLVMTQVVRADMVIPAMPPTAQQLQQAENRVVPGQAVPVGLQVASGQDQEATAAAGTAVTVVKARIKAMLEEILQQSATLVLVSERVEQPGQVPVGYAKNLIITPVAAKMVVEAVVTAPVKGVVSQEYTPVEIRVKDHQGQLLGSRKSKYRQDREEALGKELSSFLAKYLELAPAPLVDNGDQELKRPLLRSWIESSDGTTIRIGSKVAIYYTSDTSGYVSVYHFGSSGMVQRIYPNSQQPFNFIEAGSVYRYPKEGYLSMNGPVGEETVKLILTTLPSNTPREQGGGLSLKMEPLRVIPTHFPVLFSDGPMHRFFALPEQNYTETHINYSLQPAIKE
ncbi:DUF4384 domain-containing protein [Desulfogranum mediterraneum]|uniref:DUF4384 domain-containing protein n=1 Tax=Desulfogranum mediterraneum TaxID=160661 RepID=UPI000423F62F|nr:DUF4384 domain-containing protein [Desulfogranum mediterraneum]